jgi:hypothetical protein
LFNKVKEKIIPDVSPPLHSEQYFIENLDILKVEGKLKEDLDEMPGLIDTKSLLEITDIRKEIEIIVSDFKIEGDFLDDFPLSEQNEEDLNNNFGILEEEDEVFTYNSSIAALSKEKLQVLNFAITDIFVEKPYKRKYRNKEYTYSKQSFLVNRIKHLPPLDMCVEIMKYTGVSNYKILSLTDYIETLSYLQNKFSEMCDDIVYNNIVYSCIYFLFCNTYITNTKDKEFYYSLDSGHIRFNMSGKLKNPTEDQVIKICNAKNIVDYSVDKEYISFIVEIDAQRFMEKYRLNNNPKIADLLNRYHQDILDNYDKKSSSYYDNLFD